MTKEEIKKAILDDEECLDGIVDIIYQFKSGQEEPEKRFLDYELCFNPGGEYALALSYLDKNTKKIAPHILAATVGARIPGAKWAAVDERGTMYFYKYEPTESSAGNCWFGVNCEDYFHNPYRIHCPVDAWTKAKWKLE